MQKKRESQHTAREGRAVQANVDDVGWKLYPPSEVSEEVSGNRCKVSPFAKHERFAKYVYISIFEISSLFGSRGFSSSYIKSRIFRSYMKVRSVIDAEASFAQALVVAHAFHTDVTDRKHTTSVYRRWTWIYANKENARVGLYPPGPIGE